MTDQITSDETRTLSFDEFDELHNPKPENNDFDAVVEAALSRRGFLSGTIAFGSAALLAGTSSLISPGKAVAADTRFGFKAVPASTADTITVPEGYNWQIAAKWGDGLWADSPEFNEATRGTAESQARQFGDNNDGMSLFANDDRHVLVVNNEYTNRDVMFGNRPDGVPANDDDVNKGKAAHGVTVAEIREENGKWAIVKDSPVNRRITPDTPMELTGPARGHDLMKTAADPTGTTSLGTWNNCGNGRTPWGTYLACEENFNGYFSAADENHEPSAELARYGVRSKDWGYGWAQTDERFDVSKHPNEPNRAGYVVEIDPMDPNSTPKKRTALGRFKHENAEVVINSDGRIVVYMGDDERGEFLYKYVSDGVYAEGGDTDSLMDEGTLYAAKFSDDGTGTWLALTPENTGMSKAEICIHTRQAASKMGATTMDRPEWVAANPLKAEVYCALTNNKNRGKKPNAGGDPTPVGGPNPREANNYGQIVRWRPTGSDHTTDGFTWDLYVMAGNPTVHSDAYAGSSNVNAGNMFNSPDGISFDTKGLLWIQTDGKYSNEGDFAGHGNNQMLVGDPATGEIRRFLTGPNECEVTGIAWSADRRTAFVGIQHPGEDGNSHWPGGGDSLPRSAIVAIRRDDGAVIG
ncbi:MAG: PhoX family phosphatase [Pseudomonadota bacterium]